MKPLISGAELRKFATPSEVHVDELLTEYATNFQNAGFVGEVLFPGITVRKQSGKYAIFDKARKDLRIPNTLRAPKTVAKAVDWDVEFADYKTAEYALAAGVDDDERDNADSPIEPDQRASDAATIGIALDREDRIATKATTAANYSADHVVALAGANQWSDVTSNPKVDIDAGKLKIQDKTGVLPNLLVVTYPTFLKLTLNNAVKDAIKYTQFADVTEAILARYLGVDRIAIAGAMKNTAAEGAAAVIARIWGKNAVLAFVDPNSSPTDGISFGKTFRVLQRGVPRLTRRYREERARTDWLEVSERTTEELTAKDCGYLLQTVIA